MDDGTGEFVRLNPGTSYTVSRYAHTPETRMLTEDDYIELKTGETAHFELPAGKNVKIVEVLEGEDASRFTVRYFTTDSSGNLNTELTEQGYVTTTEPPQTAVLMADNTVNQKLKVHKDFEIEGKTNPPTAPDPDKFKNVAFVLQSSKDGTTWTDVATKKYSDFTEDRNLEFDQLNPLLKYRVIEQISDTQNGQGKGFKYSETDVKIGSGSTTTYNRGATEIQAVQSGEVSLKTESGGDVTYHDNTGLFWHSRWPKQHVAL